MKKLLFTLLLCATVGLNATTYYAIWKCDGFRHARGYTNQQRAYEDAVKDLGKKDIKYRITQGKSQDKPKFNDKVVTDFCS